MRCIDFLYIFLITFGVEVSARKTKPGYGFGEQDYGYFEVRKGAHMFWWIQFVLNTTKVEDAALILWIAGGPGIGTSGLGNLGSTGPTTQEGQYRAKNWAEKYNLLFIDSPVGGGYSYAEDPDLYNSNDESIAIDLYKTFKHVLTEHPEFNNTPFYIYSNSYGAKECIDFAKYLHDMIQAEKIKCNLKGFILGHGLVNAMVTNGHLATQAYIWGVADQGMRNELDKRTPKMKSYIDKGLDYEAADVNIRLLKVLDSTGDGIDGEQLIHKVKKNNKNIVTLSPQGAKFNPRMDYNPIQEQTLKVTMNGAVKKALNIPQNVTWEVQYHKIFYRIGNSINPRSGVVQYLLRNTDLKISVVVGCADGAISPISALNWIKSMDWPEKSKFFNTTREMIWVNGILEGYKIITPRFGFFSLLSTGHLGFYDNPSGTMAMLITTIGY